MLDLETKEYVMKKSKKLAEKIVKVCRKETIEEGDLSFMISHNALGYAICGFLSTVFDA